jgi:hypothetical protein
VRAKQHNQPVHTSAGGEYKHDRCTRAIVQPVLQAQNTAACMATCLQELSAGSQTTVSCCTQRFITIADAHMLSALITNCAGTTKHCMLLTACHHAMMQ